MSDVPEKKEIKISSWFFLAYISALIMPFFFYKLLGWHTLGMFGLLTLFALFSLYALRAIVVYPVILLIFATVPYMDMFNVLWSSSWLMVYWGVLVCIHFIPIVYRKWLNGFMLAILLLVPVIYYFEYAKERQNILANRTFTLSGSIPKNTSSFTEPCGKGASCKHYYLDLAGIHFHCHTKGDMNGKMEQFICQDIYQHAGKIATAQYILENQKEARLVSLHVDNQTLWSPEQTLAWYQHRERTVWHEFGVGLLLISLPFTLLFLWARRLAFQAA
nr:hypothetical protein [Alysiella crassa]UOP07697.1 hypothetical protein LVJ80_04880 [Alysiella crassa]